jgi:hypothetical protein
MTQYVGSVPLQVQGRVTNSDPPGMHVLVEHDEKHTGGYFIFQWPPDTDLSGPCTFDDWVESAEALEKYFAHAAWDIQWRNTRDEATPVI